MATVLAGTPQGPAGADEKTKVTGRLNTISATAQTTRTVPGTSQTSTISTSTSSAAAASSSSSSPAPGPRITRTKRGIVYDYSAVGGGEMRYVYDDKRDWCEGSVTVTCYGPKPKPVDPGKPGRPAPPPPPQPPPLSPTEIVRRTIVNVRLPSPKPNIDPGHAVTGLKAYLETGNSTTHTFDPIRTVLGPLSITASSSYTVNWGDGTTTGPHNSSGGKYPDGTITHVYRETGTVDITVTQNWTAQWSLAGQSGTITGLSSSGDLPNFVVREVQALRER